MGIEDLYPRDEENVDLNLKLKLDIIAIHGLNGNLKRTWTEHKSQKLWLRDFLPKDIPQARVMTFGYDATAVFGDSTADIIDHARDLLECLIEKRKAANETKRPLILIGHSLGGLVTKQALILASDEPRYKTICTSTAGIIFFGTPHQGSSFASDALFLIRIPTAIALKPDPRLLRTLKIGSDVLKTLTEAFENLQSLKQYHIVSFYEMKTMVGMKRLIVEKTSAIMTPSHKHSTEEKIPVHANHREMCQFDSADNQTYKRAIDAIERILTEGSEVERPECNKHWLVPDRLNKKFTGRSEIRRKLEDCLLPDRYSRADHQHYVLFGLGGSGKSQIALKFASDHRERFRFVFWIDASTASTVSESFLAIARLCSIEQTADSVKSWLAGQDHWLLIIDNADDPDLKISDHFPPGHRGAVLITTRNPDFQKYGIAGASRVDKLSDEDAVAMLLSFACIEEFDDSRRESAAEVVKALGNLALAIVQAGAVIRQGICSLSGFLALYLQQSQRLLEIGRPDDRDYEHSIYTTWEISVQKIEMMEDRHATLALALLGMFSFLHWDDISLQIFENAKVNLDIPDDYLIHCDFDDARPTTTETLTIIGRESLLIRQSLRLLIAFSLVSMDGAEKISMHPLVHEWSRERMSDTDRAIAWKTAASTLAMSTRWEKTDIHHHHRRYVLPHIQACLAQGRERLLFEEGPDIIERLVMSAKFSNIYQENGRIAEALNLELKDLECRDKLFRPEHQARLYTVTRVAELYTYLGDFRQAVELHESVLELSRRTQNDGSIQILHSMSSIAGAYINLGEVQKGFDKSLEAFAACERSTGKDSEITLSALALMATAYGAKGNYTEAAMKGETLLDARKKQDNYSRSISRAMTSLALTYDNLGDLKKCKNLLKEAIALCDKTIGEYHYETAKAFYHLIAWHPESIFWFMKEGVSLRKEAVRRMEIVWGKQDPKTLQVILYLAESYVMTGTYQKAKRLQERSVNGLTETLGELDPWTIKAAKDLARTCSRIALRKSLYWWIPGNIYNKISR